MTSRLASEMLYVDSLRQPRFLVWLLSTVVYLVHLAVDLCLREWYYKRLSVLSCPEGFTDPSRPGRTVLQLLLGGYSIQRAGTHVQSSL